MVVICSFRDCRMSTRNRKKFITLHKFPRNKELEKEWLKVCERKHRKSWDVVCSLHFSPESFNFLVSNNDVKLTLKPGACPAPNLPVSYEDFLEKLPAVQWHLNKKTYIIPEGSTVVGLVSIKRLKTETPSTETEESSTESVAPSIDTEADDNQSIDMSSNMTTKWGIAGSGLISADFVTALKELEDHEVVAVAARSLDRAEDFAKKFGVSKAYGSYEELSKDPDIDVVYVGVIHPYHLSVSSMMINAGKPVLCEKPLCMNVKETKQLVDLARKKKVFLMEAVWSRFFPVYKEMMKRIESNEIGDVVQVITSFGQPIKHVDRITKKSLGGGSTLDLGIYCVQFASLVMGGEKPLKIMTGGHLNSEGIDETTSATLVYSNGRVATLMCSLRCALPCEGIIVGTKGTLKVNYPMWCSESLESPSGKFESSLPKGRNFNFVNSQGLMYEAMEVRECLQKGLLESPSMTLDETVTFAEIMETMRKQVGVSYSQDN